jgi:septal ring factor EnvC (AmiA/AmiB activator)
MKNHVRRKTPTGPSSPTAHAKVKKTLRRERLQNRIKELEAQIASAAGETRKNLRDRFARVTGELAEARKSIAKGEEINTALRATISELNIQIDDLKRTKLEGDPVS